MTFTINIIINKKLIICTISIINNKIIRIMINNQIIIIQKISCNSFALSSTKDVKPSESATAYTLLWLFTSKQNPNTIKNKRK